MSYLEKRANLFYALLTVPPDVRHVIGKVRFVQSLKTGNKAEAALRASVLVGQWKGEITKARGTLPNPKDDFWETLRREYAEAKVADMEEEGDGGGIRSIAVLDAIRAAARKVKDPDEASLQYRIAIGKAKAPPAPPERPNMAPLVTAWKGTLRKLAPKSIDQAHRDVVRMADHFVYLDALTGQQVNDWLGKLLRAGATASTFKRLGKHCRSFWDYLQLSETVPMLTPDPFANAFKLALKQAPTNERKRLPFTAEELSGLYAAALANGDQPLADLIALGAYSGGRIEELCKLTTETAGAGILRLSSKTDAGKRECPVHPSVVPLVARLSADAVKRAAAGESGGYLIPSAADNQYGNRSGPLSQRFGHLKTAHGFGKDHVFHSLRHTVVTLMHQAGVASPIISDVVGHEKGVFTLDKYGSGSSMAQKLEALAKVAYPGALATP
jgi:integrase